MASSRAKSSKSPKRQKSPGKSKRELVIPDAWIDELGGLEINEDKWNCNVAIIEETCTDATVFVEHFNESAISGTRLAVKAISKLEVMKFVVKNMTESNPGKGITPLALLSNEIFKTVGSGFETKISSSLLAHLIKYMILDYKKVNKNIREGINEKHKEIEEYQQSLWYSGKSGSPKGSPLNLGSKGNKSKPPTKVQTKGKAYTKLRRRGEEWMDVVWIDDAPIDGPQLYITISTFFDADLPLELLRLKIPLSAIIKLDLLERKSVSSGTTTHGTNDFKKIMESLQAYTRMSAPYLSSNLRRRVKNEMALQEDSNAQILYFWDKIHELKNDLQTALMFKSIMFLNFIPHYSNFVFEIKSFQEEIYKQISHFLYDIFETTKQHTVYLKEMKVIDVFDNTLCNLSDMQIYNSLLDNVPHEALTIPYLLDALIAQSCDINCHTIQENTKEHSENGSIARKPSERYIGNLPYISSLHTLLHDLNIKYDLFNDVLNTPEHTEIDYDTGLDSKQINFKTIIKYSDYINIKTFHLEKSLAEYVRNRTNYILEMFWGKFLKRAFFYPTNDGILNKLCNEIIKVKDATGEDKLYYYIHLLAINSILNSILLNDTDHSSLSNSCLVSKRIDLCEGCQLKMYRDLISVDSFLTIRLVDCDSFKDSSTYSLSDELIASTLFYIEDMATDILFQKLQAIYHNFQKIEIRYCPFTEQTILVFHNILSPNSLLFQEDWVGKLPTRVPVRDFVDYILEEEKTWLSKNSTQLLQKSDDKSSVVNSIKDSKWTINTLFPDSLFISHRSIKYEILIKQQKSQKTVLKSTKSKSKTPSEKTKSDSKKAKGNVKIPKNEIINKIKPTTPKDTTSMEEIFNDPLNQQFTFIGYDLGEPMRFQYMGCKKSKVLSDNCKIVLNTVKKLYGEESDTLTLSINGNNLYYNCNSSSKVTSDNSFHVILSSGIVLYFRMPDVKEEQSPSKISNLQSIYEKKQSITVSSGRTMKDKNSSQDVYSSQNIGLEIQTEDNASFSSLPEVKLVDYSEITPTYYLRMSTPSGLHIETIHSDCLMYIRQQQLSKGPVKRSIEQERFRCYLSSGYIVKFMLGGEIEVLGSNGTIYNIYELRDKLAEEKTEKVHEPDPENNVTTIVSESSVKDKRNIEQQSTDELITNTSKNKSRVKGRLKSTESHKKVVSRAPSIKLEDISPSKMQVLNINSSFDIVRYKCTTSDGESYIIQNTLIQQLSKLLTLFSLDIGNNCIHGERVDSVTTTHFADGSLVVNFPDGSRITSIPVETDEFFCEWSSDELTKWFTQSTDEEPSDDDFRSSLKETSIQNTIKGFFSNNINGHNTSTRFNLNKNMTSAQDYTFESLCSSCINYLLKSQKPSYSNDGFVVYNVSYRMEHPNYGSVHYDASNYEVELKLPFCTKIRLNRNGSYNGYFDGVNLLVDCDTIHFNNINEDGVVVRSMIVSTQPMAKNPTSNINHILNLGARYRKRSIQDSYSDVDFIMNNTKKLHSLMLDWILLYSSDELGNEIFVDQDLNFHEILIDKYYNRIEANDFSCFVINKDLSGFRLVSEEELKSYLSKVKEKNGLIRRCNDKWASIFTSTAVLVNESEKWLMEYEGNTLHCPKGLSTIPKSTYGPYESWTQPFVERDNLGCQFFTNGVSVVRYLHRIPTEQSVLIHLKTALENFKSGAKTSEPTKIIYGPVKGDLDLTQILKYPKLLCQIYKEENIRLDKEKDKFRVNMKQKCLHTIVNQACIKAKQQRQKRKNEELKEILRSKKIPPYHLSCFGQVHNILDEVLGNISSLSKPSSTTSIYDRVNVIIDEILSMVCRKRSSSSLNVSIETYTNTDGKTESAGITNILSEIIGNVCELTEKISYQNMINTILEKPLDTVSIEEVDMICRLFESGSTYCPVLENEEFILQDILHASFQLSHYFKNLREMLEFHRCRNDHDPMIKDYFEDIKTHSH